MSVLKEDGTRRLIQQILASLKVGKIAIMDKVLNINSKNPVENGVITQAINGINNRLDECLKGEIVEKTKDTPVGTTGMYMMTFNIPSNAKFSVIEAGYFYDKDATTVRGFFGANRYISETDQLAPVIYWEEVTTSQYHYLDITVDTRTLTSGVTAYAKVLFY